jgi:hypothetical protein
MAFRPRTSRKILVASVGVATMSYVISCGGTASDIGEGGPDGSAIDAPNVGNEVGNFLEAGSDGETVEGGGTDGMPGDATLRDTIDEFPVANLVAVDVGTKDAPMDVTPPTDVTPPKDAKTKDTIDDFPVANLVVHPG